MTLPSQNIIQLHTHKSIDDKIQLILYCTTINEKTIIKYFKTKLLTKIKYSNISYKYII